MNIHPMLCSMLLFLLICSPAIPKVSDDGKDASTEERTPEELGEKRDEDALIQSQFDYSAHDIREWLVVIKHEAGSSSGFIAAMDGKTYLFTNQHVILGADKLRFTTASGKKLLPRKVELSVTRDIARLLLSDETEGFGITDEISMDSPVGIFGKSDTDGVSTGFYGKVTGVGAELVEVSADFVSENSGSPVLNISQEVLGIASYVRKSSQHAMKEGTRFENSTRRFCYRLEGDQWKSVNWKRYNAQFGIFYHQNALFMDGIIELLDNWSETTPRDRIDLQKNQEKSLVSWVESHNTLIDKLKHSGNDKRFATEYAESLKRLSETCSSRARTIRTFSKQQERELTGFLRDEFDTQAATMDSVAKVFTRVSHYAQDYR